MWISRLKSIWANWLKEESLVLFSLAWPVAVTLFLHTVTPLISLVFIGHVSKHDSKLLIDATSLAISFINVTGYAVIYGLSTAVDTLSSQAYGAKNYRRVGIILQRSILVCSLAMLPVAVLFLNSESILLILHQSPCVARLTGQYTKIAAIALPAMYLEVLLIKYLLSQGIVKPTIVTALIGNVVNVVGLALLLYVAGLQIEGAAITIVIVMFALLFSIMLYMFIRKPVNKTWQGFSTESLEEWKEFLWLAIPGVFVVGGEWWAFEIGSFVTGSVDGVQLAAFTITLNIISSGFVIPYGIGMAAGIRVGNMLGAGEPGKARKAAIVAVCFAVLWSFFEMVFLLSYRNIGQLFTTDREVIDVIGTMTFLGALFVYSDNLQAVFGGILRGCGKQLPVAIINVCSYYLLGLPIAVTLVYAADMGAVGFWLGCTVGSFTQFTLELIMVLRINYNKESEKARVKAGVISETAIEDSSANDKVEEVNGDVITDDSDVEMMTLISSEELEETSFGSDDEEEVTNKTVTSRTSSSVIKLLLIRTPWYIIGLVVLVTGVVLSQYRVHLPYEAECDDMYNDNFTNSTTPAPFINGSINDTELYF